MFPHLVFVQWWRALSNVSSPNSLSGSVGLSSGGIILVNTHETIRSLCPALISPMVYFCIDLFRCSFNLSLIFFFSLNKETNQNLTITCTIIFKCSLKLFHFSLSMISLLLKTEKQKWLVPVCKMFRSSISEYDLCLDELFKLRKIWGWVCQSVCTMTQWRTQNMLEGQPFVCDGVCMCIFLLGALFFSTDSDNKIADTKPTVGKDVAASSTHTLRHCTQCIVYTYVHSSVCFSFLWFQLCVWLYCIFSSSLRWDVRAFVFAYINPFSFPSIYQTVRRSRPLKDSSLQPQYQLPKYNCSWESSPPPFLILHLFFLLLKMEQESGVGFAN